MAYFPISRIIGADGLNFCVRNGNRCGPIAIDHQNNNLLSFYSYIENCKLEIK